MVPNFELFSVDNHRIVAGQSAFFLVGLTGFEPATTRPPDSVYPGSPVPARPTPPADLQKSSQRIPLRPNMFRATCDKRVTTSAARQPNNSKAQHPECPPGTSRFAPNQSAPTLATAPSPRASGSPQPITTALDHPHAPPVRHRSVSFHSALSRLPDLAPSNQSRVRGMAHRGHQTSLCQPTTATNTRVIARR